MSSPTVHTGICIDAKVGRRRNERNTYRQIVWVQPPLCGLKDIGSDRDLFQWISSEGVPVGEAGMVWHETDREESDFLERRESLGLIAKSWLKEFCCW